MEEGWNPVNIIFVKTPRQKSDMWDCGMAYIRAAEDVCRFAGCGISVSSWLWRSLQSSYGQTPAFFLPAWGVPHPPLNPERFQCCLMMDIFFPRVIGYNILTMNLKYKTVCWVLYVKNFSSILIINIFVNTFIFVATQEW